MAGEVRITVDHGRCVGSTLCIQIAASTFSLNEHGQSTVVDPTGDTMEKIIGAAENCPMEAIRVDEVDTGAVLFP
jgi:ferredoxin